MEIGLGILQVLAIFIALPVLAGIIIVGFLILWGRRASAKQDVAKPVCSVDADCPKGYVCLGGRCVPQGA